MVCGRKKSMIVSDNTIEAEGLGSLFKKFGKTSAKTGKKLATNVVKKPGRALEDTSNIATKSRPQLRTQKQHYHHYLKC